MKLIVEKKYDGGMLRDFLKLGYGFSSRLISSLKREGGIKVNNRASFVNEKVFAGDVVEIVFPQASSRIASVSGHLDILFEDDFFMAVNKPSGMPCHPSLGHKTDTLANIVAAYFEKQGINSAVRIPARLDSTTTGAVIIAKNEYIAERFSSMQKEEKIRKTYLAIVQGKTEEKGEIDAPIGRKEGSIIERCVDITGKPAKTFYRKIKEINTPYGVCSLVEVSIQNGRTHQIRVHFAHIGHSLLGDWLYGMERDDIKGPLLHLEGVEFSHPVTKEKIIIKAPYNEEFERFIQI